MTARYPPLTAGTGLPRGDRAAYARGETQYYRLYARSATPRGALRAQAVLNARTRTRFLPRDPARAEEATARAPGTPRVFFLNREINTPRRPRAPKRI